MNKNTLKINYTAQLKKILLGSALIVAVFGCSSTVEQNYYLLSAANSAKLTSVSGEPILAIRSVRVPDYLAQQNMAEKLTNGTVSLSYQHLWADRLQQAIPQILAMDLASILKHPVELNPIPAGHQIDTILEVEVSDLIASDKQLNLLVKYRLITKDKIQSYYFKTAVLLSKDDGDDRYAQIAKAHEKALNELAQDISNSLLKQMDDGKKLKVNNSF